ncbi:MAG: aldo/keto reductase [Acidobacteria bacterium]|nr:aldo/keto reductase [Acidobacteriota bacterium]MBS1867506.1 aldo/keto reductase [Acidobacteriota bacterium]
MHLKELGKTGVFIPEIGLGTWDYKGDTTALRKGLDAGAMFIDTAESYGTELLVGRLLSEMRHAVHKTVFVATKISPQNFRAKDLRNSVDSSLSKLGVETIDLMQLHEPNGAIPIEETMGALAVLVDSGKIRFCGVSNFSVRELQAAQNAFGKHKIVSNQVRYNLIDRTIEKEILPYCQANDITVIAYSPLAKGVGRILDCDPNGTISRMAQATGKTPAQIMINWCNFRDGIVSIPKSNSAERVLENCGASGWRLSPDDFALLNREIKFRHRTNFDSLVRKLIPRSLHGTAVKLRALLPRGLRRRIT